MNLSTADSLRLSDSCIYAVQGQLWGYCEVVQVAQQSTDTLPDEPASKRARLQESSAVTNGTLSEQVHTL